MDIKQTKMFCDSTTAPLDFLPSKNKAGDICGTAKMQQRLRARKTSGGRGLEDWGCGGKVSWPRSRPVAGGGEILLCGEAQNLPGISVISDLVSEKEEFHTDFYRTAEQEEAQV